jgi:hypothetical protein
LTRSNTGSNTGYATRTNLCVFILLNNKISNLKNDATTITKSASTNCISGVSILAPSLRACASSTISSMKEDSFSMSQLRPRVAEPAGAIGVVAIVVAIVIVAVTVVVVALVYLQSVVVEVEPPSLVKLSEPGFRTR